MISFGIATLPTSCSSAPNSAARRISSSTRRRSATATVSPTTSWVCWPRVGVVGLDDVAEQQRGPAMPKAHADGGDLLRDAVDPAAAQRQGDPWHGHDLTARVQRRRAAPAPRRRSPGRRRERSALRCRLRSSCRARRRRSVVVDVRQQRQFHDLQTCRLQPSAFSRVAAQFGLPRRPRSARAPVPARSRRRGCRHGRRCRRPRAAPGRARPRCGRRASPAAGGRSARATAPGCGSGAAGTDSVMISVPAPSVVIEPPSRTRSRASMRSSPMCSSTRAAISASSS